LEPTHEARLRCCEETMYIFTPFMDVDFKPLPFVAIFALFLAFKLNPVLQKGFSFLFFFALALSTS
jgi:hypothetical protein